MTSLKLYVVADGMGGHQAGEVASDLVVKTVKDYMERFMAKTMPKKTKIGSVY